MFIFYKKYNKYNKNSYLFQTNNLVFLKADLFKGIRGLMKSFKKKSGIKKMTKLRYNSLSAFRMVLN